MYPIYFIIFKDNFIFIYLLIFVCVVSLLLHGLFSSCSKRGLLSSCGTWASHCGGFSCCRSWALGSSGLSSCGSWALEHSLSSLVPGLSYSAACGILLCRAEPMSPALANRFLTTKPPRRRRQWHPTPVLLPGKFHGRRSLVGYSPWGC